MYFVVVGYLSFLPLHYAVVIVLLCYCVVVLLRYCVLCGCIVRVYHCHGGIRSARAPWHKCSSCWRLRQTTFNSAWRPWRVVWRSLFELPQTAVHIGTPLSSVGVVVQAFTTVCTVLPAIAGLRVHVPLATFGFLVGC